jgi:hypothetical protein
MQTLAARPLNAGTVSDRAGRRGVATLAPRRAGRLPSCAGATVPSRQIPVPHACVDRRRVRSVPCQLKLADQTGGGTRQPHRASSFVYSLVVYYLATEHAASLRCR